MHWDIGRAWNPFGRTDMPDDDEVNALRAEVSRLSEQLAERTSAMDDAIALAERLHAIHEAELGVCERHCEVVKHLRAEHEALGKRRDEVTRPTIRNIVGIIASVVCDEECPVETGGPACLKERTRCMDAYQREAKKIYAQVVEPLKEEIEALNALAAALDEAYMWRDMQVKNFAACLNTGEVMPFLDMMKSTKHQHDTAYEKLTLARARLEEVRNGNA